jgi:hypothetical protein
MSTDESPASAVGTNTRGFGEHQAEQALREREQYDRYTVQEAIKDGRRALIDGDYPRVVRLGTRSILPRLSLSLGTIDQYHARLTDSRLAWDYDATHRLIDEPEELASAARHEPDPVGRRQRVLELHGWRDPSQSSREVIARAFLSLESAAAAEGVIPGELSQSSDVYGLELGVGLQWQPYDYETPDEVRVANPDIHPPFTMSVGIPGNGKSTSVDTLAEDAYAAGHKVIDLLDYGELENGLYDVPNHDEQLRSARERLGLPASFADHPEYDRPKIEILHPLCPRLCDSQLPYDTERAEFTARPFVIPVADMDHPTIKQALGRLTDDQEKYVTRALEELDKQEDDWSLADLGEAIVATEARSDVVGRLMNSIETLQNRGFFGTRDSKYAIDWDRIFKDTDTITVFSASLLEQKAHKLLVSAYQLRAIFEERKPGPPERSLDEIDPDEVTSYPRALMVMREMQTVAPSNSKMKGGSNAESTLKRVCVDRMQTLAEERRHVDMGIHGDTQQWFQFNARVRENVDRILMFKLQAGAAEYLFDKLTGDEYSTHARSVSEFDIGECAVVGSGWIDTGQSFAMPVQWAPPMCHHLDAEDEDQPGGWTTRVQLLDSEEFRESPFELEEDDGLGVYSEEQRKARRMAPDGFEEFAEECLRYVDDVAERVPTADVRDCYAAYAEEHGLEVTEDAGTFGHWMRGWFPKEKVNKGYTRGGAENREHAYIKMEMTDTGKRYLDGTHGDFPDADGGADVEGEA